MKKSLIILTLLFSGCLNTENRTIQMKTTDSAEVNSNVWWTTPYYSSDNYKGPWDEFVPAPKADPLDVELEFFDNNALKWPKTMPPPRPMFKPLPPPPVKKKRKIVLELHPREVY